MNSKNIAVILVVVVVIGLLAWGFSNRSDNSVAPVDNVLVNEAEINETNTTTNEPEAMVKSGEYKIYSEEVVAAEQTAGNKVVLFFHAPWCPFCRTADKAFLERTSEIPSGVTVLKTDYDSNDALKDKYGVTYQHTFVQIDAEGNLVTKWNGGDIENVKKYVK